MKKILVLIIALSIMSPAYSFSWFGKKKEKKGAQVSIDTNSGYVGTLPDIESEFDYLRPNLQSKDIFKVDENADVKDLIPAPRKEKMYIDVIKKKDKTSDYIHDLNDIVLCLEKLKVSIIQGIKTSVFNAQVSYFVDLVYDLQREYGNKPESAYISYKRVMELSNQAYSVAVLRREASYYGKYLAYSDEGYIYSPEYVNEQMQYLLDSINAVLPILKDVE